MLFITLKMYIDNSCLNQNACMFVEAYSQQEALECMFSKFSK